MMRSSDPAGVRGFAAQMGSSRSIVTGALNLLSPRRRLLQRLRAVWGAPGDNDGWLAERYFELWHARKGKSFVDAHTWGDLEFPAIFRMMDTAVSAVGSQCLYARLHTYSDDPAALQEAYDTYRVLSTEQGLREGIQLTLQPLQADTVALLPELLFGEQRHGLKRFGLVRAWSVVCVLTLLGVALQLLPVGFAIGLILINMVVLSVTTLRVHSDVETLRHCKSLLRVADALGSMESSQALPQLAMLAADRRSRIALHRTLRWYALSWGPPLSYISSVLNFLVLWELVAFSFSVTNVRAHRAEFARTFELVGSLDAAICIASFLAQPRMQTHCLPSISDEALIDIIDGYHPLLAAPVVNSVRLHRRSALVSGSNMAGKTTFIKMIGTNIVLGRTIGVCLAACATIPRANVCANIRSEHSIVSGKSRFFSETERVLSFTRLGEAAEPRVLLIDEIFSGTNTRERVAAAYAVLKALSAYAQVLATTHDVELQILLVRWFEMMSFVEDPSVAGYFDYRVHSGASRIGNAIRLLEKVGFPAAIVADAMAALAEVESSATKPGAIDSWRRHV